MRRAHGVAGLALIGAIGIPAPAQAQHVEGRASMTAAVSYNQTVTDAPFPNALTLAGPSASLGPAGILVVETPLTDNTFTYNFTLNVPFNKDLQVTAAPLSYSNRFSYSGRYQLSELSNVSLTLSLTHTPQNTLGASGGEPTQAQLDPIPVGAAYMLAISAQQGFTRQLSPSVSLQQTNGLTFNDPVNAMLILPRTIAVQNALTLSRTFTVDTLGVSLSVATSHFTVGEGAGGAVIDAHTQLTNNASLTWSRPLGSLFSMSIQAGATQVVSPGSMTPMAVQPSGSLSLTYRLDPAMITASYAHMAAPNLLTSTVNFTDSGTLRFSVPIGTTGIATSGSGGITHMEPIGSTTGGPTNTYMGDASLTYHPPRAATLTISTRFQVSRQSGSTDALGNLTRYTTSLNFTYSYPSATAAMITPPMAPALGATPYVPGASQEPLRPFEVPPGEESPAETPAPESSQ